MSQDQLQVEDINKIPFLKWQSMGHDILYCFAMERLQIMLISAIQNPGGGIVLNPLGGDEQYNGTLLEYDGMLDHMWRYLSESIQHRHASVNVKSFCIYHVQLPPSLDIARALRGENLTSLRLHNNNLGSIGLKFAAALIEGNAATLKEVSLVHNRLDNVDMEAVNNFAQALRSIPSGSKIQTITFEDNDLGQNSSVFDSIIHACGYATLVTIKRNNLALDSARSLSDFISRNHPSLRELDLPDNNINDQSVMLISQGLRTNSNLEHLTLNGNIFTEVGRAALLKSIYDTTSLNSLVESNHTCQIEDSSPDELNLDEMMNMNLVKPGWDLMYHMGRMNDLSNPVANKKKKIVSALLGAIMEHYDFTLLEETSVKCMPGVFELVQIDPLTLGIPRGPADSVSRYRYSWTLIFEILRGWELPVLFSFR